jgi:class 3 adenylate cyclase
VPCRACGHQNEPLARFCNQCGAPLGGCPHCGGQNPPGSRFCQGCGQSLAGRAGGYTPRHLAEDVLRRGGGVEGERKQVTVLFADVAGFTALAERLDPENVHAIMDACFAILLDEIHRFEGTINQFTGDGVMSLFGAPVAHEDHARLALNAALGIQRALGEFEQRLRQEQGLDFRMRIGLNSGPVIVGRIGDDLRSDYTAVGDTTNLAARMLTLAEPGGVVVTEHTYRLAQSYFTFVPLGEVTVKGRQNPVQAYRVTGLGRVRTRMQAAATRGLTPFVGRERELAALTDAFTAAAAGTGQVVTITGEAGIGKSRLVHEFVERLTDANALVCEAACAPYTRGFPYYPFIKIVRDYCEIGDDDDESRIREKARRK